MLGQSAGTNLWSASLGFIITGVGLPFITILAFGFQAKMMFNRLQAGHTRYSASFSQSFFIYLWDRFSRFPERECILRNRD